MESLKAISEQVAGGIISYEMRQQTLKREIDEELKYQKGLLNESYNQFLAPILADVSIMISKTLKAEKVVLFLHNKDIDHLYSFSTTQAAQQAFAPDSIRMKSNLGLAGKAFTTGKIQIDCTSQSMIPEERDLNKLKIKHLKNALAIPINGAKGQSSAVLQVYNFQEEGVTPEDEKIQSLASLVSGILLSVESLQEQFIESDIVEAHFNLIQDAVMVLSVQQTVIKVNRSALSMIGVKSADVVLGKHVTEVISGPLNNHLFNCFKEMVETKTT